MSVTTATIALLAAVSLTLVEAWFLSGSEFKAVGKLGVEGKTDANIHDAEANKASHNGDSNGGEVKGATSFHAKYFSDVGAKIGAVHDGSGSIIANGGQIKGTKHLEATAKYFGDVRAKIQALHDGSASNNNERLVEGTAAASGSLVAGINSYAKNNHGATILNGVTDFGGSASSIANGGRMEGTKHLAATAKYFGDVGAEIAAVHDGSASIINEPQVEGTAASGGHGATIIDGVADFDGSASIIANGAQVDGTKHLVNIAKYFGDLRAKIGTVHDGSASINNERQVEGTEASGGFVAGTSSYAKNSHGATILDGVADLDGLASIIADGGQMEGTKHHVATVKYFGDVSTKTGAIHDGSASINANDERKVEATEHLVNTEHEGRGSADGVDGVGGSSNYNAVGNILNGPKLCQI